MGAGDRLLRKGSLIYRLKCDGFGLEPVALKDQIRVLENGGIRNLVASKRQLRAVARGLIPPPHGLIGGGIEPRQQLCKCEPV